MDLMYVILDATANAGGAIGAGLGAIGSGIGIGQIGFIQLPGLGAFPQAAPERFTFFILHDQVIEGFRTGQIFPGCVQEGQALPFIRFDGFLQFFESTQLDLEIFLARARVFGFVLQ